MQNMHIYSYYIILNVKFCTGDVIQETPQDHNSKMDVLEVSTSDSTMWYPEGIHIIHYSDVLHNITTVTDTTIFHTGGKMSKSQQDLLEMDECDGEPDIYSVCYCNSIMI